MDEITMPKIEESETGGIAPKGYEKYVLPSGMKPEDEIKLFQGFLQKIVNKIIELEKKVDKYGEETNDYKKELNKQTSRNIEIIGLFSSILALLIIDVSIIKSVDSFLSAILLITALTCSVIIFASLIHLFFAPSDKIKFGKYFWIPNLILMSLIVLGLLLYFLNININKINPRSAEPKFTPILQQKN